MNWAILVNEALTYVTIVLPTLGLNVLFKVASVRPVLGCRDLFAICNELVWHGVRSADESHSFMHHQRVRMV